MTVGKRQDRWPVLRMEAGPRSKRHYPGGSLQIRMVVLARALYPLGASLMASANTFCEDREPLLCVVCLLWCWGCLPVGLDVFWFRILHIYNLIFGDYFVGYYTRGGRAP